MIFPGENVKIVYLTASIPYGVGEEFVLNEMLALKKLQAQIVVVPRTTSGNVYHAHARGLLADTIKVPLFSFEVFKRAAGFARRDFKTCLKVTKAVAIEARSVRIAIKNLLVLPKAIYLAEQLQQSAVTHIHAHWGSTTSTMAHVISLITGIPWSMTLHRWDIEEDNLLHQKARSASFVRCISAGGKQTLHRIIGRGNGADIKVLPMGVAVPEAAATCTRASTKFTITVPARLLPVKGHKYLIEACSLLLKREIPDWQCIFYGDGPLRGELQHLIATRSLMNRIRLAGYLSHEQIIEYYGSGQIDVVVVPSIHTSDGQHEGIPVSLMEAMAYGIPVISTATGSIPELLGKGAGLIVPEKDPAALADAITKLMLDRRLYNQQATRGRQMIIAKFNLRSIARELLTLFSQRAHHGRFEEPKSRLCVGHSRRAQQLGCLAQEWPTG